MSVGNSNLTGLAPRIQVQKPAQANQANRSDSSPRANALANTNANSQAPAAPAVSTPGSPVAAAIGGTTAPAGRSAASAQSASPAQSQLGSLAAAAAMASSPALMASLGAAALTTNRGKVSSMSGDAGEEVGDVDRAESEEQADALQEADTEQGSGEINAAGSASGPSA